MASSGFFRHSDKAAMGRRFSVTQKKVSFSKYQYIIVYIYILYIYILSQYILYIIYIHTLYIHIYIIYIILYICICKPYLL